MIRGTTCAELRALALLRSRLVPLAAAALGEVLTAAALALALGPESGEAAGDLLLASALVVTLVLLHGVVVADVRSGVVLLWLQKPVSPVRYYLSRAAEVTACALVLVVALALATWLVVLALAGAPAARALVLVTPTGLLWSVSLAPVVFACSAWGAHPDTLLGGVFFFYFTWVASELGGVGGWKEVGAWSGAPLEDIAALGAALSGAPVGGVAGAALAVARYVLLWTAAGTLGLVVTLRSPLPGDVAR